jgi:hypothetical protein
MPEAIGAARIRVLQIAVTELARPDSIAVTETPPVNRVLWSEKAEWEHTHNDTVVDTDATCFRIRSQFRGAQFRGFTSK